LESGVVLAEVDKLTESTIVIDREINVMPAVIPPPAQNSDVDRFRSFNRFYTHMIGTLTEGLLNSEYSLTEARVLYELAMHQGILAREIADELSLDAGYLSRILRKFENAALIRKTVSESDARQMELKLTSKGKALFDELNERSNQQAEQVLEKLTPGKRSSLLHSMSGIVNAMAPERSLSPYVLRQNRPGDMGWVISRHAELYAKEHGWDEHFEALVANLAADFITKYDPRLERCWIAERDGERLGCVFLVRHRDEAATARLRMLLVEPSARGLGLGKALVQECVSFARTAGYKRVILWTVNLLSAAQHIYQQAGFKLVQEQATHRFGADMIDQTWELEL
jgi:DNA-binding MarR family transcriptional regulator/GNAT superfamily N-acetyltransferase